MMIKLLVLNGPNLNLLGLREPKLYGSRSYDELCAMIRAHAERGRDGGSDSGSAGRL